MSQPSLTTINDVGNATARIAAFVEAWRAIQALQDAAGRLSYRRHDRDMYYAARNEAYDLTAATAARFGVDASDVMSAGRVLAKLTEGDTTGIAPKNATLPQDTITT